MYALNDYIRYQGPTRSGLLHNDILKIVGEVDIARNRIWCSNLNQPLYGNFIGWLDLNNVLPIMQEHYDD